LREYTHTHTHTHTHTLIFANDSFEKEGRNLRNNKNVKIQIKKDSENSLEMGYLSLSFLRSKIHVKVNTSY